jgi:hypothetical protein
MEVKMAPRNSGGMTPADYKRIALSLEGVEEGSHMGAVDFRVDGNLALTPEEQSIFCQELPDVFLPISGGWGRMGMTHILLAKASEDVIRGALQTAWRLRVEADRTLRSASPVLGCVGALPR